MLPVAAELCASFQKKKNLKYLQKKELHCECLPPPAPTKIRGLSGAKVIRSVDPYCVQPRMSSVSIL